MDKAVFLKGIRGVKYKVKYFQHHEFQLAFIVPAYFWAPKGSLP